MALGAAGGYCRCPAGHSQSAFPLLLDCAIGMRRGEERGQQLTSHQLCSVNVIGAPLLIRDEEVLEASR